MNTRFDIKETSLSGLKRIIPFYKEDNRGYFLKSFEKDIIGAFGLETDIYEEFESFSYKDVIRGMHFQTQNPQAKIVRALKGTIYDVVVDLRKNSSTFGQWQGFELSEDNHESLWIPAGFAHGFRVLSDSAITSYKCMSKYLEVYDTGIKWNDPDIAIEWNILNPVVSPRDDSLMGFQDFVNQYGSLEI